MRTPNLSRALVVAFRIATALVAAAGLVGLGMLWGPTRALVLYALGRTSTCPLDGALRAPRETAALIAAGERVSKNLRLIRREAETGLDLWQTDQGPFWIVSSDEPRWLSTFLAEQDSHVYGSRETSVRPGDFVLDCGAHYGLFTRNALRAGAQRVVAIEPAPVNLECLRRNLAREIAVGRVAVCPKGVWDRDDYLTLRVDRRAAGFSSFVLPREGAPAVEKVPLTTIDELVAELNLPRVDLIKMDIEGAERRALAGARQTLRKHRPRLSIAVYHLPGDGLEIPRLVEEIEPRYRRACPLCLDWGVRIEHSVAYFY